MAPVLHPRTKGTVLISTSNNPFITDTPLWNEKVSTCTSGTFLWMIDDIHSVPTVLVAAVVLHTIILLRGSLRLWRMLLGWFQVINGMNLAQRERARERMRILKETTTHSHGNILANRWDFPIGVLTFCKVSWREVVVNKWVKCGHQAATANFNVFQFPAEMTV